MRSARSEGLGKGESIRASLGASVPPTELQPREARTGKDLAVRASGTLWLLMPPSRTSPPSGTN